MATTTIDTTPLVLPDGKTLVSPFKSASNSTKQIEQFKKLTIYSKKSDTESDESTKKEQSGFAESVE